MIGQLILITLFGTSFGSDRLQTLHVPCSVNVTLTFPNNSNELPNVTCSLTCQDGDLSWWFKQSFYYHDELLEDYHKMVKVELNKDGDINCDLVSSASDEVIKKREKELEEKCLNSFLNENGVTETPGGGEHHMSNAPLLTTEEVTPYNELTTSEKPVTPVIVQSQGNCEEGYEYVEEFHNCFGFSNYTAQWFDAESACAADGAVLAILNSLEKQEAIEKRLMENSWIGLVYHEKKGEFEWRNGSPLVYANWAEGEPNYRDGEHCVEMARDRNFMLNDEDCAAQKHFICEKVVVDETVEDETDENLFEKSTSVVCPDGWIKNNSDKERGKCYHVSQKKFTWHESNQYCRELGGYLPSFFSLDEMNFVVDNLVEDVWIGANGNATTFSRALCWIDTEVLPRKECPEGWQADDYNTCYKMSSYVTSYDDASKKCSLIAVQSQLFVPADEMQNDYVKDILTETIWLDINDIEEEGVFKTIKGVAQTYFNWKEDEPNNQFQEDDCVEMEKSGTWNDDSCDKLNHFICVTPEIITQSIAT